MKELNDLCDMIGREVSDVMFSGGDHKMLIKFCCGHYILIKAIPTHDSESLEIENLEGLSNDEKVDLGFMSEIEGENIYIKDKIRELRQEIEHLKNNPSSYRDNY